MRHDLISDALSTIKNGETVGKRSVSTPASKIIKNILLIMQRHNFIGNFEFIDDGKGGKFKVQIIKAINNCGAIRPRFSIKKDQYEKYERRFLPAAGFGILIVSTSKGLLAHIDAKNKIGGKLIAYVY